MMLCLIVISCVTRSPSRPSRKGVNEAFAKLLHLCDSAQQLNWRGGI